MLERVTIADNTPSYMLQEVKGRQAAVEMDSRVGLLPRVKIYQFAVAFSRLYAENLNWS